MGIDEKKIKVGLSARTTTDRSPSRPCRVCGGNHWDKDCNKKKASNPSRPCKHCGGEHYDNNCPTLRKALITEKTKHKSGLSCHACGDNHKVINCPLVKYAKESITGKKCDAISTKDVEDTEDILQLTRTLAKLSKVYDSTSMAAIKEFAEENAGIKRDKKDAVTTKGYTRAPNMSLGLMCGSDITKGMLLLDSCSQEHVI